MGFMRKALNWYARLSPKRGRATPPYTHVVQIGDPLLRRACGDVPVDKIQTEEIQTLIKKLRYVITKYDCLGMSAPQIGVNLRIFAMCLTTKQLSKFGNEFARNRGVIELPFTVFVNPTMKILDYNKVVHQESCESVKGFAADVARHKKVEISGYNHLGEQHTKQYSDWSARIVQHELDHLDGIIYTDIMNRKTFTCYCWEEVNLSQGKVVLPFGPE